MKKKKVAGKAKQEHQTPAEVKQQMASVAEQAVNKECAAEIEAVLKKYGRALQPFIQRTEEADIARVRLVEHKEAAPTEVKPQV